MVELALSHTESDVVDAHSELLLPLTAVTDALRIKTTGCYVAVLIPTYGPIAHSR